MEAETILSKYQVVFKHLQEFLNVFYCVKDISLKKQNANISIEIKGYK
ncbi:Uncharacterised protein [uncultured Bacteroides sp.]|nr:Uncharacterised protein [uncultured Bacteroides sp.]